MSEDELVDMLKRNLTAEIEVKENMYGENELVLSLEYRGSKICDAEIGLDLLHACLNKK